MNIQVNEYIHLQDSHIVGRVPCDQSLEAIKYNSCKKDRECVKAKKEVSTIFVQIFVSFA